MRLFFGLQTFLTLIFLVLSPVAHAGNEPTRILMMGDSLFAFQSANPAGIAISLAAATGADVTDRSVSAARIIYRLPLTGAMGLNIGKQFREGNWDWVVVNGGGNDLWLGCGCGKCDRKLGKLISKSGQTGAIPKLVTRLRNTGARVIYVGYLRSPGVGSPIENCKDEGDALEARLNNMAAGDPGVFFLPLSALVPHGDRSFHAFDMIHTSRKASAIIGQMIGQIVSQN